MNWRRWWFQVGTSNALSIWSWLFTLPMALGVSMAFQPDATGRDRWMWVGYLLAVQLLLGALMWIAAQTMLPRETGQSRPIAAVVVFMCLGAVRAVAMDVAAPAFNALDTSLGTRLVINVLAGPLILAVIAVVVDTYRRHATVMQRLQQAQASLDAIRSVDVEARALDEREMAQQVFDEIAEALSAQDVDPEEIKRAARDLVRTRSHEIERSDPISIPQVDVVKQPGEVLLTLSRRMRIPSAWPAALTIEVLSLPVVAAAHGWAAGTINAVVASVVIAATLFGGHLLWRWLPRRMRGGIGVLLTGVIAGLLAVTVVLPVVRVVDPSYPLYLLSGVSLVTVFVVGVSLVSAIGSTLRSKEDEQAQLVSEAAGQVQALRTHIADRRRKVAAFLHGPIQAELLVASASGVSVEQVMASLQERFAQFGHEIPASTTRERIDAVSLAWSAALTITRDIDEAALIRADAQPGADQVLVDALSEGFANALRHASSTNVQVMIRCVDDDAVELRVLTEGSISATPNSDGIGLRHLQESARAVELSPEAGGASLIVRV